MLLLTRQIGAGLPAKTHCVSVRNRINHSNSALLQAGSEVCGGSSPHPNPATTAWWHGWRSWSLFQSSVCYSPLEIPPPSRAWVRRFPSGLLLDPPQGSEPAEGRKKIDQSIRSPAAAPEALRWHASTALKTALKA